MPLNYQDIGRNTVKGDALHQLAENYGLMIAQLLSISGALTNAQDFTINKQVHEIIGVTTTTGVNTASGQWNQTSAADFNVTITAHALTAPTILRVQNEFFTVVSVIDANTVKVKRAQHGSANVVHADGQTIFKQNSAPTTGKVTMALSDLTTAATCATDIKNSFNAVARLPNVKAAAIGAVVLFSSDFPMTVSETLTNGAFAAQAGNAKGAARQQTVVYAATAGDVTAGIVYFPLRFTPTLITFSVRSAAGVAKAHDGAKALNGNVASLDNSGATDFVATDIITLHAVA